MNTVFICTISWTNQSETKLHNSQNMILWDRVRRFTNRNFYFGNIINRWRWKSFMVFIRSKHWAWRPWSAWASYLQVTCNSSKFLQILALLSDSKLFYMFTLCLVLASIIWREIVVSMTSGFFKIGFSECGFRRSFNSLFFSCVTSRFSCRI